VSAEWREAIRATMPELPEAKRARFVEQYGITAYDAGVLTATRALADYFENVVRSGAPAKLAANWIITELLGRLNEMGKGISESPVSPERLAKIISLMANQTITTSGAKATLTISTNTGRDPEEIVATEGLRQISDTSTIERAVREVIEKNRENVAKYRAGNEGVFNFFVGQVMRATRGQANPQIVNEVLQRLLASPAEAQGKPFDTQGKPK